MHTVELLEHALSVAEQLGYKIRQEWLGGTGGGACEFGGQKWLFVDLALNAPEQLDQVRGALLAEPAIHGCDLIPPLRRWLGLRQAG
jgi:hypothetical protein